MIIVLLGIDGAGKTSAGKQLAQRLSERMIPATFTANPSGRRSMSSWCERYHVHPPMILLDTVETVVRCLNVAISHFRARGTSRVVVMDRYLHCQLALRRVRGLRQGWLLPKLLTVLPTPDVVFYFEVPTEVAYARINSRASDVETPDHLQFFDRAYRALEDFPSFIIIDASQSTNDIVEDMVRALWV